MTDDWSGWALRGLPITAEPAQWRSGGTVWEGVVDVTPHGPDVVYGTRPGRPGDMSMPSRVELTFTGTSPGAPTINVRVEVRHHVPQLVHFAMTSDATGGLQTADLRYLSFDRLVAEVAEATGWSVTEVRPGLWAQTLGELGEAGRVASRRPRQGRPRRDPELLATAADYYRAHARPTGALEQVALKMGVSRSTAALYVRLARERGLLPARTEDGAGS